MSGGRSKGIIPTQLVIQHLVDTDVTSMSMLSSHDVCFFESYIDRQELTGLEDTDSQYVLCNFSFAQLGPYLSRFVMMVICAQHHIQFRHSDTRTLLCSKLEAHDNCSKCASSVMVVHIKHNSQPSLRLPAVADRTEEHLGHADDDISQDKAQFPPNPPSSFEVENLIREFCSEFDAKNVEEVGCAACAQLGLKSTMRQLAESDVDLLPLYEPDNARQTLSSSMIQVMSPEWPTNTAILERTDWLCEQCYHLLSKGR